MATRTAKGIIALKAAGTILTLSNVSLIQNHAIFAIVGWKGTGVPTVKAGTKDMEKVIQQVNATSEFGAAIYYKRVIRRGNTRDIVATWASSTTARVMAVLTVSEPMLFFEGAGNIENSASPTTSQATSDLPVHNCFHLAGLIAEGPDGDSALSVQADWCLGQRDGTAGIPPISNITLTEVNKTGRCIDPEECDSSGSVARDYCSVLASFKPIATIPPVSYDNEELAVGDTVKVMGEVGTTTISSFTRVLGNPFVKCVLADGRVFNAHNLEVVE